MNNLSLISIILINLFSTLYAQDIEIRGRIIDVDSSGISGASVSLVKNGISATTDKDGIFIITNKPDTKIGDNPSSLEGFAISNNTLQIHVQNRREKVKAVLYDLNGSIINQIVNGILDPGKYEYKVIAPSVYLNAITLLKIEKGKIKRTIKLFNPLGQILTQTHTKKQNIFMGKSVESDLIDVLLIKKAGFFSIRFPLENLQIDLDPIVGYKNRMTAYDSSLIILLEELEENTIEDIRVNNFNSEEQAYAIEFETEHELDIKFPVSNTRKPLVGIKYDSTKQLFEHLKNKNLENQIILLSPIEAEQSDNLFELQNITYHFLSKHKYWIFIYPDSDLFKVTYKDTGYIAEYYPWVLRMENAEILMKSAASMEIIPIIDKPLFNRFGMKIDNPITQFYLPKMSYQNETISGFRHMPGINLPIWVEPPKIKGLLPMTISTHTQLQLQFNEMCNELEEPDLLEELIKAIVKAILEVLEIIFNIPEKSPPLYLDGVKVTPPILITDDEIHNITVDVDHINVPTFYEDVLEIFKKSDSWIEAVKRIMVKMVLKFSDLLIAAFLEEPIELAKYKVSTVAGTIVNGKNKTLQEIKKLPNGIQVQAIADGEAEIVMNEFGFSGISNFQINRSKCPRATSSLENKFEIAPAIDPFSVTVKLDIPVFQVNIFATNPEGVEINSIDKGLSNTNFLSIPPAKLYVDGVEIGESPKVLNLEKGPHEFKAVFNGREISTIDTIEANCNKILEFSRESWDIVPSIKSLSSSVEDVKLVDWPNMVGIEQKQLIENTNGKYTLIFVACCPESSVTNFEFKTGVTLVMDNLSQKINGIVSGPEDCNQGKWNGYIEHPVKSELYFNKEITVPSPEKYTAWTIQYKYKTQSTGTILSISPLDPDKLNYLHTLNLIFWTYSSFNEENSGIPITVELLPGIFDFWTTSRGVQKSSTLYSGRNHQGVHCNEYSRLEVEDGKIEESVGLNDINVSTVPYDLSGTGLLVE